ncbi:MAG: hypothetical protein ABIO63_13155 [Casimicrobiaceae bacterium]
MNRALVALAAGILLASGSALACNDMKASGDYDGGVIVSKAPAAPVAPTASTARVAEPPLVVTQKQAQAKKTTTAAKPLPQGAMVKTGN